MARDALSVTVTVSDSGRWDRLTCWLTKKQTRAELSLSKAHGW